VSSPFAEPITSGKPIGVDVAAIERELDALWRQASDQQTVLRACCWNLAAYAQTDADFTWARELSEIFAERLPTRTLLLHHQPDLSGKEVEAWVSARCKLGPQGTKLLCFEEITIETQGNGIKHLPSLVRALVESDTPTAVLWSGRPPKDPSVALALLTGADVLMIDSSRDAEPGDLASLELQAQVGHVEIADAQWLRGAPVREAIAAAFDRTAAGPVTTLDKVLVRVEPPATTAGLYLLGWLASRLGWGTPERLEPRRDAWMMSGPTNSVRVELETGGPPSPCGVCEVELSLWSGARITVRQTDDGLEVAIPGERPLTFSTGPYSPGATLTAALTGRGHDRLYAAALHRAGELDRAR